MPLIRDCEEFEMALQHNSKLGTYRELKQEVGFEEYLEYVKEASSRLLSKFHSGTHGLFEELGRHAKGVGHWNVLIVELVRSRLSMFLLSVHHTIPRDKLFWTTCI